MEVIVLRASGYAVGRGALLGAGFWAVLAGPKNAFIAVSSGAGEGALAVGGVVALIAAAGAVGAFLALLDLCGKARVAPICNTVARIAAGRANGGLARRVALRITVLA
jgi:hypothetical protein